MSTITKELAKLFRKITNSEIDAEGNAHVVLSPADSLLINNARIALASLEVEAVAYMHHSGQVVTREECCDDKIFAICCKVETPLYAAPQLPQPAVLSVPAAMEMDDDFDSAFEHGKAVGWNACRTAMLQSFGNTEQLDEVGSWNNHMNTPTAQAANSPVTPDCWCHTCRPVTMSDMRFVVCPDCGNKRCPHANDHRHACTGSNEPGQEGSAYQAAPQQEVKRG